MGFCIAIRCVDSPGEDAAPENAWPAIFPASPKTHTPWPQMKERGLRFYRPELGRWVSRDPIMEKGFHMLNSPPAPLRDLRTYRIPREIADQIERLWPSIALTRALFSTFDAFPDQGVPVSEYGFCHNSALNYADALGLSELPMWVCKSIRWVRFGELLVAYEYYQYAKTCYREAQGACESLKPGQMYLFPAVPGTPLYVVYRYKSIPACMDEKCCKCKCIECCLPELMVIVPKDDKARPELAPGVYVDPLYQPCVFDRA